MTSHPQTLQVWWPYWLSVATLASSAWVAACLYPGSFDWQYTVVSALASQKHNPEGGVWFSAGIGLSLLWLWPFVNRFRVPSHSASLVDRIPVPAMKSGIVFGAAMALESLFAPALPAFLEKTHEALALLCFVCFYLGALSLALARFRRRPKNFLPIAVVALPLLALGLGQLSLYLHQRNLGWIDRSWREMGVPLWQSFAFWQWLALAFLWIGVAALAKLAPQPPPDYA